MNFLINNLLFNKYKSITQNLMIYHKKNIYKRSQQDSKNKKLMNFSIKKILET